MIRPRSSRRSLLARAAVAVALLTALTGCGGSGSDSGPSQVTITAADGSETTLADLEGTPLVVNMWATWCKPCVREMPAFQEVADENTGVTIIGVNIGETPDAAAKFAADLGVTYPQYTDETSALYDALSVTNMPTTVFIGADGKVLAVHSGAMTADDLRAKIASTFGTSTSPTGTT